MIKVAFCYFRCSNLPWPHAILCAIRAGEQKTMRKLGCGSRWLGLWLAGLAILTQAAPTLANPLWQQQSQQPSGSQDIPDAPSATRPPQTFPGNNSAGAPASVPATPPPTDNPAPPPDNSSSAG